MTTGRILTKKILQKAGIVTKNEDPSADETNDTLDAVNNMLSSWANDSLLVFYRPEESFTLSSGVDSYTIGSGGDFDTVRPVHMLNAHISLGGIKYQDLSILNDVTYQRYVDDEVNLGAPIYMNYNNNYPLGTIKLNPIPSAGYELTILSEKPLTSLTLDGVIQLPDGWERAIIFNGAKEIMSEYGQQLDALTNELAKDSINKIKTGVAKNTTMDSQPMGTYGSFDLYRGW